jgi:sRNA-binding protein
MYSGSRVEPVQSPTLSHEGNPDMSGNLSPSNTKEGTKALRQERELLAILCAAFPKTFAPRGAPCSPLAIGIDADLKAAMPELSNTRRCRFLSFYTRLSRYQRALKAGASRIDLQGDRRGEVTQVEADFAATQIQDRLSRTARPKKAMAA